MPTANETGHDAERREVRWGILGAANIATKVVGPAIAGSSNGRVLAVASRDAKRARAFANDVGAPRAYGGYPELLGDADVDAIYIPLPNSLHAEWTRRALQAGKHVLCEKPMATTEQECHEMERTARDQGRLLMEAFMYRFHPRSEALAQLLRSGGLGDIKLIRSTFTFSVRDPGNVRFQRDLGGGSLFDVGSYCVNAARTFLGEEPHAVQAWGRWGGNDVDIELAGAMRFPSGAVAHVFSALTLPRQEYLEVIGTEGRARVDAAFLPGNADCSYTVVRPDGTTDRRDFEGTNQYRLMVEHFANSVLSGEPLRHQPLEAANNLRAIEGLLASARHDGQLARLA